MTTNSQEDNHQCEDVKAADQRNLQTVAQRGGGCHSLGESRSSIYRSIERGDLPLPVFRINGRLRVARRAVERLIAGELPAFADDGFVEKGFAS
jgi:hypothetical protein